MWLWESVGSLILKVHTESNRDCLYVLVRNVTLLLLLLLK